MVSDTEKKKYWCYLNLNYVTEESDDPQNPNGFVEHKLEWRSSSECFNMIMYINASILFPCHILQNWIDLCRFWMIE